MGHKALGILTFPTLLKIYQLSLKVMSVLENQEIKMNTINTAKKCGILALNMSGMVCLVQIIFSPKYHISVPS